MKKISQAQQEELGKLQSEKADKESAEADFQQKLTDSLSEKMQLKVSLWKKEGE